MWRKKNPLYLIFTQLKTSLDIVDISETAVSDSAILDSYRATHCKESFLNSLKLHLHINLNNQFFSILKFILLFPLAIQKNVSFA